MKIVYMGTPDFAVGALKALCEAGFEVVCAVTQPDKPKGRSGKLVFSPVKEYAIEQNIPVFQPEKIRTPESVEYLKGLDADLYVVAAFGQILSQEVLDIPRFGCVNIHASLLPKYRGAAPIQWSIINGDAKSGVTLMKMDVGLDTGDILMQEEIVRCYTCLSAVKGLTPGYPACSNLYVCVFIDNAGALSSEFQHHGCKEFCLCGGKYLGCCRASGVEDKVPTCLEKDFVDFPVALDHGDIFLGESIFHESLKGGGYGRDIGRWFQDGGASCSDGTHERIEQQLHRIVPGRYYQAAPQRLAYDVRR